MAIIGPSSTLTRFMVLGRPPRDYQQSFLENIREKAFVSIEHSTAESSVGWVEFDDFTSNEFAAPERTIRAEVIALTLRCDQLRVPATVKGLYLKRAERRRLQETGRTRLSRSERQELREQVTEELLGKVLPVPSVYEVVWSLDTNVLFLGTTNRTVISTFMDLFTQTFGLDLRIAHPFALGPELALIEDQLEDWERLEPVEFAAGGETGEEAENE